jgi:hypothetical protein
VVTIVNKFYGLVRSIAQYRRSLTIGIWLLFSCAVLILGPADAKEDYKE